MGEFTNYLFIFFSVSAAHGRLECGPDAFRSMFGGSE